MPLTCKILSPESKIFDGEIKKISLPTEIGALTILPGHKPITTRISPGILRIDPVDQPTSDFIFHEEIISISVAGGFAFVGSDEIHVVTSTATTSPDDPATLQKMATDLESQLQKLSDQGAHDELQKTHSALQKLRADLELAKLSN